MTFSSIIAFTILSQINCQKISCKICDLEMTKLFYLFKQREQSTHTYTHTEKLLVSHNYDALGLYQQPGQYQVLYLNLVLHL